MTFEDILGFIIFIWIVVQPLEYEGKKLLTERTTMDSFDFKRFVLMYQFWCVEVGKKEIAENQLLILFLTYFATTHFPVEWSNKPRDRTFGNIQMRYESLLKFGSVCEAASRKTADATVLRRRNKLISNVFEDVDKDPSFTEADKQQFKRVYFWKKRYFSSKAKGWKKATGKISHSLAEKTSEGLNEQPLGENVPSEDQSIQPSKGIIFVGDLSPQSSEKIVSTDNQEALTESNILGQSNLMSEERFLTNGFILKNKNPLVQDFVVQQNQFKEKRRLGFAFSQHIVKQEQNLKQVSWEEDLKDALNDTVKQYNSIWGEWYFAKFYTNIYCNRENSLGFEWIN